MPSLTLNDRPVDFALDPDTPLLWALRDVANLTGTKYGCGTGECGACMVLVDGQVLPSCTLSLADAMGRSVTTIEALARTTGSGGRHPVIQALIDEQAIQCGFCTPGLVVAIAGLLASNARPTDEEIGAAITNICRCGVYPRVIRAIRRVTGPVNAAPAQAPAAAADGAASADGEPGAQATTGATGTTAAPESGE